MPIVHIDEIMPLSPMQWFMLLEEPELLPKVCYQCKSVQVDRFYGKTNARYEAVVGPISSSIFTDQSYQQFENGDIEIKSTSSGPFNYARAKWILKAVENEPTKTHIIFQFDYEFSNSLYSLFGNPILAKMAKGMLPAIYKQGKPVYDQEEESLQV